MYNKIILIGNVSNEPSSTVKNDLGICKFNLATSDKRNKTEFHRIVTFGKLADLCTQYVKKGKQIFVEGRVTYSQYEKDGTTKYYTDILADVVRFLSSKKEEEKQVEEKEERLNFDQKVETNKDCTFEDIPF